MGGYAGKISSVLKKYGYGFAGNNRPGKCPFCGHKRFFVDDITGVWSCNSNQCQKSGGTLDFAYEFYTLIVPKNPKDKKEAIRMLEEDIGIKNIQAVAKKITKENWEPPKEEVPIERRNLVYRRMLKHCNLKQCDLEHLLQRGYTKDQVKSFGYISLPTSLEDRQRIARLIQSEGISVKGIPGFEFRNGEYQIADFGLSYRKKIFGKENLSDKEIVLFLIPSYDMHGKLQYFQIAWDKRLVGKKIVDSEEKKFAKYTMFSTPNAKDGGKIHTVPGYIGFYKKNASGILIPDLQGKTSIPVIEGCLKTALYFELCGRKEPCIAQVGVNNYKALKKFLEDLKKTNPELEQVEDAYDMDKFENPNVKAGAETLESLCEEVGLKYHMRKWNPEYKGIDDYAFAWRQEKIQKRKTEE